MKRCLVVVCLVVLLLSGCARPDLTTEWSIPETTATTTAAPRTLKELRDKIIRITKKSMYAPDSAGGVSLDIDVQNMSDKEIKYVNFEVSFFNNVGDPAINEISTYKTNIANVQLIGPIAQYGIGGEDEYWDCIFYNSTAKRWSIDSLEIIYMDGDSITLDDREIALID